MEAIKGYIKTVKIPIPATAQNITFQVEDSSGNSIGAPFNPTSPGPYNNGWLEVNLPYAATSRERRVVLTMKMYVESEEYTQQVPIDVETPLLELWEIEEILEGTTENPWQVESAVRHVINSHCGQEFGLYEGSVRVQGTGDRSLRLPRRALRIESIGNGMVSWETSPTAVPPFVISGGGWSLRVPTGTWYNVKADLEPYATNGPITPPYRYNGTYSDDITYTIKGKFGFYDVPEPVREAAKLLINDYACQDSVYRDRYIEAVTAADWRLQYNAGAYRRTGNARADNLLAPFIRNSMVIV